ncbi:MAG: electron transfer flavoprotein-ubiquinone oxidoreductase [archaeon]|nr:electron transfer flavoprotein-ubiquinone oxidoreductase [archaeon]
MLLSRSALASRSDAPEQLERESDAADVVIIGGGPSGLAAAIRLRQQAIAANKPDFRVVVLEKAAELGAHILSGAVIEPRSLTELLPNWREDGAPLRQEVTSESWRFLTSSGSIPIPALFPEMKNHGNYIISLGELVRWMGDQAEALGVEIFPGFAASEVLYAEDGSVVGVATNDVGIAKDGSLKPSFQRGMEFHARLTVFAEGCRGHLTQQVEKRFHLRESAQHQTYGIGLKELWKVPDAKWRPGHIQHTFGWPVDASTYAGSFLYHYGEDNLVGAGFVVGLSYKNPHLDPFREFQKWKTHPQIREAFAGGECVQYGARAISAGGLQSLPQLYFPGGVLIGDSAGFLNVPKIKGSHAAIKSGSLCADAAFPVLEKDSSSPVVLSEYADAFRGSWLHDELHTVRNFKPAWKYGTYLGSAIGALDSFILRGKTPWTLSHSKPDDQSLKPASQCTPPEYPKPDGVLTFDRLTSVARTNTNHEEDQPCHLTLKDPSVPVNVNLKTFDGPEQRFCPAGVYEFVQDPDGSPRLQINQSNCIHCKTCDIKDPNIVWVSPEGGGGPIYPRM